MSFDWKATLATVAPALATALGGPLAGVAVGMATKALGLPESTQEALQAAVMGGGPDTLLKLKECDNHFTIEMERIGVDLERVHAGDRSSARDLAIKTNILPQMILATIFVSGFVYVLNLLFSGEQTVHESMKETAIYLLGILSGGIAQIMNFFFGSSSGSMRKSDAINRMAGK